MDDLIEYINGGNCILFLGAGVSRSAGLPDWSVLASLIAEDFKSKLDKQKTETWLSSRNIPHLFGDISRTCGEKALLESCIKHLRWSAERPVSRLYSLLLNWGFQAFFTTNFDDLIRLGLNQRGLAASVHTNSRKDLAAVDIDSILSIVKLHGDLFPIRAGLTGDQTIILTDDRYLQAEAGDDLQYLRDFLAAYLRSKRILFLGYSFSDPDIQLVLKQVAVNLRRVIPLYALIGDISDDKIDELYRNYNLRIIPYQNKSGTHQELLNIVETLNDYILLRGATSPRPVDPINLKRAQALFFWHKLQLRDDVSVHVDAIKSLLISTAREIEVASPIRKDALIQAVQPLCGINSPLLEPIVTTAIGQLIIDGLFIGDGNDSLHLSQKAKDLADQYSSQYQILIETFKQQVKFDFGKFSKQLDGTHLDRIAETIFETLIDVFSERAIEIIGAVWETGTKTQRPPRLFRTIAQRAATLEPRDISYEAIRYVTRILAQPSNIEEQVLQYLSRAFICANALSMDPEGNHFRREFLRERSVFVDANILIPVLAKKSVSHDFLSLVLSALRDEKVPLFTTEGFVDELYGHGAWARWMVTTNGSDSYQVYEAAIGAGHYKRNALLDGFIRYCNDVEQCGFDEYLAQCVDSNVFNSRSIGEFIEKTCGIKVISLKEVANKKQEVYVDKEEVEAFVKDQAALREMEKSEARAGTEAEAFAIISNWDLMRPLNVSESGWRASLLSQGGFLNRIARYGPRPLQYNVVMRADVVYEFLVRLGRPGGSFTSFKDVMLSSYFNTSAHFIDTKKYRRFFGTLIAEAEHVYKRDYIDFQKYLNSNFTTDYLDQFDDMDKPLVVKAFEDQLRQKLEGLTQELAVERKTKAEVERELEKYREEERKRIKHIEKSKKRMARMAQIGKPGKRSARFGKRGRKKRH